MNTHTRACNGIGTLGTGMYGVVLVTDLTATYLGGGPAYAAGSAKKKKYVCNERYVYVLFSKVPALDFPGECHSQPQESPRPPLRPLNDTRLSHDRAEQSGSTFLAKVRTPKTTCFC